jgi:F-type H+-transporting ATPase subunit delta
LNKTQIAKKFSRILMNTFDKADIRGVLKGLTIFSTIIDSSKELRLLFASRIFTDDEKTQALKTMISYLKISHHTEKFLKLIIAQGHLRAIKEIIKASTDAYNERMKKIKAIVISPVKLEENHTAKLKSVLKTMTEKDVEIEGQVDPLLIGGFIVRVGSNVYDSSLRGQFRLLRTELTK